LQSRSPLLPYYQGVATPVRISRIGMAVTTPTQHPITPQFYSSSTSNLQLPSAGLGGYSPGRASPVRPDSPTIFQRDSLLPAMRMMSQNDAEDEMRRNSEIERMELELLEQEELCAKQRERLSELTIRATSPPARDLASDRVSEASRLEEREEE